jgi:hypothetical protein
MYFFFFSSLQVSDLSCPSLRELGSYLLNADASLSHFPITIVEHSVLLLQEVAPTQENVYRKDKPYHWQMWQSFPPYLPSRPPAPPANAAPAAWIDWCYFAYHCWKPAGNLKWEKGKGRTCAEHKEESTRKVSLGPSHPFAGTGGEKCVLSICWKGQKPHPLTSGQDNRMTMVSEARCEVRVARYVHTTIYDRTSRAVQNSICFATKSNADHCRTKHFPLASRGIVVVFPWPLCHACIAS